MRKKAINLVINIDNASTKKPISKLVKLDEDLRRIGYVRGEFMEILVKFIFI